MSLNQEEVVKNFKCDKCNYECINFSSLKDHMNKKHWNTIVCDGSVNKKLIESWIDDSYNLVVSGLTKKLKTELDNL